MIPGFVVYAGGRVEMTHYITEIVTENKWINGIDILDGTGTVIASSSSQNKKGKLFWEQTTISSIKDKNGNIINYVAIKEDITKLKENEQILKTQNEELHLIGNQLSEQNRLLLESKNRFSNLFEKSPVSLWEEDFSEVKLLLEKKSKQASNLKLYLDENPDFVYECASKVKILNDKKTLNSL